MSPYRGLSLSFPIRTVKVQVKPTAGFRSIYSGATFPKAMKVMTSPGLAVLAHYPLPLPGGTTLQTPPVGCTCSSLSPQVQSNFSFIHSPCAQCCCP